MTYLLAFIFPVFDEDDNIINRIYEINALSSLVQGTICVVFSDDTPGPEVVDARLSDLKSSLQIDVIHIPRCLSQAPRGLAFSVLDGIKSVDADFYCIADVDGQHSMWDAFQMFQISRSSSSVVIGSRFIKGGGMGSYKHFISAFIFNFFLSFLNGFKVSDKTGGFAVLPASSIKLILAYSKYVFFGYGDYFIALSKVLALHNIFVKNYPVFYRLRSSGYSKSNFLFMIFSYSCRCFRRPFIVP